MRIALDQATQLRMDKIAEEKGEDAAGLAANAVAEAALDYFKGRDDDPAKALDA